MSFLAPLFFVALAAVAVPIFVHLIQRERKDIVEFPSLMFIRRIPYQSVERRRIHNWSLLLLRIAAMALVIAAFSRPFFATEAATAAITSGAREVVILLDRSASMGYGDHWTRAQDEARRIVGDSSGQDRATLVLFDRGVEEAVRATTSRGELELRRAAGDRVAEATRYAPALREAQSLLSRSDRQRKEAYLISDFQKSGWERQEEIQLPEGAMITPVSVADRDTANLSVSSLAIQRATFSNEERATITVGLINRSASAVTNQPVRLEIDGRVDRHARGHHRAERLGHRDLRSGDGRRSQHPRRDSRRHRRARRRTTTSTSCSRRAGPCRCWCSTPMARPAEPQFLTTGLGRSKTPPFKVDVVPPRASRPRTSTDARSSSLNDAALSTAAADLLDEVRRAGWRSVHRARRPHAGQRRVAPDAGRPQRSGRSHRIPGRHASAARTTAIPIFEQFKDPRTGSFANMRFFRYRRLAVAPTIACSPGSTTARRRWSSDGSGAVASWRSRRRSTATGTTFRGTRCSCRCCTRR